MLEIAGGILIAIAILVALPFILVGAFWAVVIGVGLAIVIGAWFALAAVVGDGWAWGISITALMIWLGWSGNQEVAAREKTKAEEEARRTGSARTPIFGRRRFER